MKQYARVLVVLLVLFAFAVSPAAVAPSSAAPDLAKLTVMAPAPQSSLAWGWQAQAGKITVTKAPGNVRRGGTASITVKAPPKSTCSIAVHYNSGPSKAKGLGAQKVPASGLVSWSWKVGTNTTPGSWPVVVTCGKLSARSALSVPR